MLLLLWIFICVQEVFFAQFIGILLCSLDEEDIPSKAGLSTPPLLKTGVLVLIMPMQLMFDLS